MSYDFYVEAQVGPDSWACVKDVGDYTSNMSPLWNWAVKGGLGELNGVNCKLAYSFLLPGSVKLKAEGDKLSRFDAPNGWGNWEGAVKYYDDVMRAAYEHPYCRFRVSR